MVVPSEKSSEIVSLVMEQSECKESDCPSGPPLAAAGRQNAGEEEATTTDAVDVEERVESEQISPSSRAESLPTIKDSHSFLSLYPSEEDSLDGVLDESASSGVEESNEISLQNLVLDGTSIDLKNSSETKSLEGEDDSALFEESVCCGLELRGAGAGPLLSSTPHSLPPAFSQGGRLSPGPAPPSPLLPPAPDSPQPHSLPGLVAAASGCKGYDYLLKVLLVGDSDVGKQEILSGLEDGSVDSPYCSSTGAAYKTTIILIDGKRVKLQLWDTSGQGRFCTIIRSYSRGAQGILLVYDITNKWSFEGMDRWVAEVEEHAPGIPKVLVGNRLHLAFKRQVDQAEAETYAERNNMGFFEVSPLVNFNITESFQELSRMALKRNGMERLWRSNKVLSLHEICCHSIVAHTNVYGIDKLPLPDSIKANLKSYALTNNSGLRQALNYKTLKERKKKGGRPPDAVATKCGSVSRKSCAIS